ncbi:LptF/LptG family permease [Prosthecomicrobium hirschii]|uniref:Lipopolysaccharide export system permease protein LptF n=1 Tax=Prosthecodimorpha hirschii TaxID=665126 RepID=A0A0P6VQ31_9HYPH|nr:LptF/LptG family permease [Prosthecomicrobium hirschii]KPL54896.1 hypothetical protein ABB55_23950 [Prosthecomicrobium hirschii]MCW1840196.1 LptF/LptG family permease [Prosthecomicrobium hirschii]TPQ52111.1 LptF/LptG family permease [Prosthecomicrobium hirschii]
MGLIERYLLKRLTAAFLTTLVALAGVVWTTQALRQMSLVTAKGQTLLILVEISVLALPYLSVVIAPFALLVAAIFTLNALNADSELVVINASGGSRMVVLRPLLILAGLVGVAMLAIATVAAPEAQKLLRTEITKVNVDLIATIVRPGRFTEIEPGLTFHIRSRGGDGSLVGLVIDDRRDKEIAYTYIADRAVVLETPGRTLLVMRDGVLQRIQTRDDSLSIVKFEAYAFDLSELTPQNAKPVFRANERSTAELLAPDLADEYTAKNLGRFRYELNDRLSQPLLPVAFAVIAFLFLGDARTNRQGRGLAVALTLVAAVLVRGLHFAALSGSIGSAAAAGLTYVVPVAVIVAGLAMIRLDRQFALPRTAERLLEALADFGQSIVDRFGPRTRGEPG